MAVVLSAVIIYVAVSSYPFVQKSAADAARREDENAVAVTVSSYPFVQKL